VLTVQSVLRTRLGSTDIPADSSAVLFKRWPPLPPNNVATLNLRLLFLHFICSWVFGNRGVRVQGGRERRTTTIRQVLQNWPKPLHNHKNATDSVQLHCTITKNATDSGLLHCTIIKYTTDSAPLHCKVTKKCYRFWPISLHNHKKMLQILAYCTAQSQNILHILAHCTVKKMLQLLVY
jgi:hypothetical protein